MSRKVEYRNGFKYMYCEQCGLDWNVSWQFVGWYVCPVCRNKSRKMGKIVVKGDWNQHDVRIHSTGLNRADAAKMLLAAFISITETLDDDIKKATFLAALSCCRDEVYSPKIEVIK